jgi:hypothetical protein
VTYPAPTAQSVKVAFKVTAFETHAVVAGVTVKVCARDDQTCATPLDTQTTDANGSASMTVPTPQPAGFDGYFDLEGAGMKPTLFYVSAPIARGEAPLRQLLTEAVLTATLGGIGVTEDPTRGSMNGKLLGCDPTQSWGLTLAASTADAQSTIGYFAGGLPSKSATATDPSGYAYALNLPVGTATLTSFDPTNSLRIGKVDVMIRAGWITQVAFQPTE